MKQIKYELVECKERPKELIRSLYGNYSKYDQILEEFVTKNYNWAEVKILSNPNLKRNLDKPDYLKKMMRKRITCLTLEDKVKVWVINHAVYLERLSVGDMKQSDE